MHIILFKVYLKSIDSTPQEQILQSLCIIDKVIIHLTLWKEVDILQKQFNKGSCHLLSERMFQKYIIFIKFY